MNSVFVDSNVFLDAILHRTEYYPDCESLLKQPETTSLKLYTSASCLLNVMYFLKKAKVDYSVIIEITESLLKTLSLISCTEKIFLDAIHSGFPDLEDAVQYYTAQHIKGIDYFISSNTKDFKKTTPQLPVITPRQFMTLYNK
ncbi:MAG: hypothetical protein EPN92_00085 [Chitinophagaceae bacterium]|nr:MAG: hypothetical protein EPN92_00085 [Chitinophagaceae bacterium]